MNSIPEAPNPYKSPHSSAWDDAGEAFPGDLGRRARRADVVNEVLVAITAIIYMVIQFAQYSQFVGDITILTLFQISLVSGLFILTSCLIFRRYGFLAAVMMHISQYILYHGLYGGIF